MNAAERSLRVALVYDDSLDRRGGVAQYVTTLWRQLRRRGHEACVMVGQSGAGEIEPAAVHSLARNLPVRFNGTQISTPVFSRRRAIQARLDEFKPDVIHVQVPFSPLFAGRVIGQLSTRTALVGTFHVSCEMWHQRIGATALSVWQRRSLRRFDRMVAVSSTAATYARVGFGLAGVDVIPNMVELEVLRAATGMRPHRTGNPHVVFVGRLVTRKGADVLLAAFGILCRDYPDVRLTIAGDGPLRSKLARMRSALPHPEKVDLPGEVTEVEKARLLASADVACLPSLYGESFGITILEAIACGAGATLVGANPGYRELLESVEGSVVVENTPASLASQLGKLLDEPCRARRIGQAQRTLIRQYDATFVTDQILALYRESVDARCSGSSVREPEYRTIARAA